MTDIASLILLWICANLVAFGLFGWDKMAAVRHLYRVPETRLLLMCLIGGVGAMAASALFRHKTRKQPFRNLAVTLSALHVIASVCALIFLA